MYIDVGKIDQKLFKRQLEALNDAITDERYMSDKLGDEDDDSVSERVALLDGLMLTCLDISDAIEQLYKIGNMESRMKSVKEG